MENNTLNISQTSFMKDEIILTERAILEITNTKAKNNIPNTHHLRVAVKGGGCSGYTYVLEFDEFKKESDHNFLFGDVSVIIDQKSMFFISGITIDFSDGLNGKGFVFNNPQATKTCGCGTSFGV